MFHQLKFIFVLLKALGLMPIKNVFARDGSHLKLSFLSIESSLFLALKSFIYLVFYWRHFREVASLPDSAKISILVSVIGDLMQLFYVRLLFDCVRSIEEFDERKIVALSRRDGRRYAYALVVLFGTIFHVSTFHVTTFGRIAFPSKLTLMLSAIVFFPLNTLPGVYVVVSHELTRRFRALCETCGDLCQLINADEARFYCQPGTFVQRLESVRLAYELLSSATGTFIRAFNFPIAMYFLMIFAQAFIYVRAIAYANDGVFDSYQLCYMPYSCFRIALITWKTDQLKLMVELFLTAIERNPINTDLNGYVSINRQLIPTLTAGFVTWFVFLTQLVPAMKKYPV